MSLAYRIFPVLVSLTLAHPSYAIDEERSRLPMKIGEITIVSGNVTQRTGTVLDDRGTAYVLSIIGANEVLILSH
ncbi:MAG: hypothetical protein HC902_01915 [Calothrix sp. SM1_5_4]|nr:hypothetical protein [Calothrix sp. SM1_5_4]